MDLQERIAQFRKMANDDPDSDLGHYKLAQLLMEAGQYSDAVASFRRTLQLNPEFSRVFQYIGSCLIRLGNREEAIKVLKEGFAVADRRGDNMPRDEIVKLLVELGEPAPSPAAPLRSPQSASRTGGFVCASPGCRSGAFARQLPKPPMNDELGDRIYASACADCWERWLRDVSIKVINEMRLDLSTEAGAANYDQIMRETLGLT